MMRKGLAALNARWNLLFLVSGMLLIGAGCNNGDSQRAGEKVNKGGKVHLVEIRQMKYSPDYLEVNKGDTIKFVNNDLVPHDVTEEERKKWTSSIIEAGGSWSMVAEENANYFCSLHLVMKGKIRLK